MFYLLAFWIFGLVQGRSNTCCPDGWLAFRGSCYLVGKDVGSFTVAEQFCKQHGGHLVHVNDSNENNFIRDRLRDLPAHHFWMGLTDEDIEGTWVWFDTDTDANFTDFQVNEIHHINEDCVIFAYNYDYAWADVACTNATPRPVCERPEAVCPCEESVPIGK